MGTCQGARRKLPSSRTRGQTLPYPYMPISHHQASSAVPRSCSSQILSWYPRIVVFPGFIDKARSEHIVKLASKYMHPSGLAYRCVRQQDAVERGGGLQRMYESKAKNARPRCHVRLLGVLATRLTCRCARK